MLGHHWIQRADCRPILHGHHDCKDIFVCMIRAEVLPFDSVPADPQADIDQIQLLNTGPPDG